MKLALELINSEAWYGRPQSDVVDHLDHPGWLDDVLERWGFAEAGAPTASTKKQLVRLRSVLRRVVTALAAGDEPDHGDLDELGRFASGAALTRRLVRDAGEAWLELVPVRRDWRWVLSEIASSGVELLGAERVRIKLCANPECRWAFYDASRNRRRRWCDSSECGNVFKVRAFRARRRAALG